jgi:hydroxysqualene dehydroxylase
MDDAVTKRVIVVGGGLAGIACAVALAAQGLTVTLVEARFALGGRAGSFEDPEHPGQFLDNCQHVLLGCCTNLLDLYRRLGVSGKIAFHPRVHFLDARGGRHDLKAIPGLPAPLHLGPAMAFFSALTLGERRAVVRAMLAMARLGRTGRNQLETTPFGTWLDDHRQPPSVVRKFYDPIVVSALNEDARRASAKYAIQVFQEAMLANRHGYVTGLPTCPLGELYAHLPPGIDLRLNSRVDDILWEMPAAQSNPPTSRVRAVGVRLRGNEELRADAVVLATNHHAVQRWLKGNSADAPIGRNLPPPDAVQADTRFAGLDQLDSVPILGAHLWFDRPVMHPDMASAALLEGPLQWLFRKDAAGRAVHGVLSAARAWIGIPKEEALPQFEAQIRSLFPNARQATLQRGVMLIEKRATFSPAPGADAFRPPQGPGPTGIAALYLAGDYTRTDWPATMEGAVRSGYLAAEAVTGRRCLVPDLPTEWPARLMGLSR